MTKNACLVIPIAAVACAMATACKKDPPADSKTGDKKEAAKKSVDTKKQPASSASGDDDDDTPPKPKVEPVLTEDMPPTPDLPDGAADTDIGGGYAMTLPKGVYIDNHDAPKTWRVDAPNSGDPIAGIDVDVRDFKEWKDTYFTLPDTKITTYSDTDDLLFYRQSGKTGAGAPFTAYDALMHVKVGDKTFNCTTFNGTTDLSSALLTIAYCKTLHAK